MIHFFFGSCYKMDRDCGADLSMILHRPTSFSNAVDGLKSARNRVSPELAPGVVHVVELVCIGGGGLALWQLFADDYGDYNYVHLFVVMFVVFVTSHLAKWSNMISVNVLMRPISHIDNMVVLTLTTFLLLLSVLVGLDVYYAVSKDFLIYFVFVSLFSIVVVRLLSYRILLYLSEQNMLGRNLAVLGADELAGRVLRQLRRDRPYFSSIVGVFTPRDETPPYMLEGFRYIGSVESLLAHAREGLVDDVIIAMHWNDNTEIIDKLKELPINVYLASDVAGYNLSFKPVLGSTSQLPAYEVVQRPISGWGWPAKRLLDYFLATLGIVILSPFLLIVALAIKIDSHGPVFFMQKRLGFNNEVFEIFKFRSMRHNEENGSAVVQATRGDRRITRVGRIIRATSIDELPQLLNVLNGTMSLVGPRPHALSHNEEYGRQIRGYFARHRVRPGITGWAQVNGFRGETKDIELMKHRVELDVYYADNWSFIFDIKIIIMTVFVVLFQRNAY